jgi:cyclopropane fatty-acyl-phospholipid synthase-like methyltransferase
MTYRRFAYIYDELMKDVPYDQWVKLVQQVTQRYDIPGRDLLDIGCGSGELAIRLVQEGWNVTGVDLSEDMLIVAQEKAAKFGITLPLFQQDMRELDGLGTYDVITIFCDSINYLATEQDVQQTFQHVYRHLKLNGWFIFDVHSIYKIMQIFMNESFTWNGDKISYIWNCFPGEAPNSVEHELTFFVLDEATGLYERFDEVHVQRTFSILTYEKWLEHAGFHIEAIVADESFEPVSDTTERVFFICQKKER